MAENAPTTKNLADLYQLPLIEWDDVRGRLETTLTQEPGTGGPGHHTFWLSTIDPNGRPHITAVGAFWLDDRFYFTGGPESRKIRNIERDQRCGFGVAIRGYDVALEGRATRVTEEAACNASLSCSPKVVGHQQSPKAVSPMSTAPRALALRLGSCTSSPPKTPMR